jgi:C_GCAxxG_C_C family probable redox protein
MDREAIEKRLAELKERSWDLAAIRRRFEDLLQGRVARGALGPGRAGEGREEILDRVQRRAEEYCYLLRNCAQASAASLFEEFGLGGAEMLRALRPFPGLAMSGGICGPVAGGLTALSLYFSPGDVLDPDTGPAYAASREYLRRFEDWLGSLLCPDIQTTLLGRCFDPFASREEFEALNRSGARERCPLAPGLGARIAAEIILEAMAAKQASG